MQGKLKAVRDAKFSAKVDVCRGLSRLMTTETTPYPWGDLVLKRSIRRTSYCHLVPRGFTKNGLGATRVERSYQRVP